MPKITVEGTPHETLVDLTDLAVKVASEVESASVVLRYNYHEVLIPEHTTSAAVVDLYYRTKED